MTVMNGAVRWPAPYRFGFSIFDDPDGQTVEMSEAIYGCLAELQMRTTKGVWPLRAEGAPSDLGQSCEDPAYLAHARALQARGFEIGYHNASQKTEPRARTEAGLAAFVQHFGDAPITMSNHYNSREAVYFARYRLSGWRRMAYDVLTRGRYREQSCGHLEGHPLFWGDLCASRIGYCRNFAFRSLDTLASVPFMPYFDADRPHVAAWYASADANDCQRFRQLITRDAVEALARKGSATILYVHFGHGFVERGRVLPAVREALRMVVELGGWCVPVRTLLDHLRAQQGLHQVGASERAALESRWLREKIRYGTS
jgi:hypothetical protein